MSKKKPAVKNAKPVVKVKPKKAAKVKNPTVDLKPETSVEDQAVTVESPTVDTQVVLHDQNPGDTDSVPSVGEVKPKGRKAKEMVVTPEMEKAIEEAKQMIKDEMNKAEAAREVFLMLKGHARKQIVYVFIVGCGLSKAGAGTYYQNCKK